MTTPPTTRRTLSARKPAETSDDTARTRVRTGARARHARAAEPETPPARAPREGNRAPRRGGDQSTPQGARRDGHADRPPRRDSGDRRDGAPRREFADRNAGGERRPYGDRPAYEQRPRPARADGPRDRSDAPRRFDNDRRDAPPRREFSDRNAGGGERRPYGDRPAYEQRPRQANADGPRDRGDAPRRFDNDRRDATPRREFSDRNTGGGERRPYGDRPAHEQRPRPARADGPRDRSDAPRRFDNDRRDAPPRREFSDRNTGGGERRPYGDRPAYEQRPRPANADGPRDRGDAPRRFDNDRRDVPPRREFSDRNASGGERRPYGDRPAYEQRPRPANADGPRDRSDAPRRFDNDRRDATPRREFSDHNTGGGERRPYGDRPAYEQRPRPAGADSSRDRSDAPRRFDNDRRDGPPRREFSDRNAGGERRPYSDRPGYEQHPRQARADGPRDRGDAPRRFDNDRRDAPPRREFSDRNAGGERRPYNDRRDAPPPRLYRDARTAIGPLAGPAPAPSPDARYTVFASCPTGLEAALCDELLALGFEATAGRAGCHVETDWTGILRINLHSRLATRVLVQMGRAPVRQEDDILALSASIPWEQWFGPEHTLRVDTSAIRSPMHSLHYCNLRAKDGICDRLRAREGARPSIDTVRPDARVHLFLDADSATLYLDTSGESLFKRGWRLSKGSAPLRENLAAGLLALSGWQAGTALVDPFCGSGTILIEAAWKALGVPPGIWRPFGFERLRHHDRAAWKTLKEEARASITTQLTAPIIGSDLDPDAIAACRENLRRAHMTPDTITFINGDARELAAPADTGFIVTNPPYGQRLEAGDDDLWQGWASWLKTHYDGWQAYLISAEHDLPGRLRLQPKRRIPVRNGDLDCRLFHFEIQGRRPVTEPPASATPDTGNPDDA